MAKFSRACLGALLLACVALPVLSAEQQKGTSNKDATAKAVDKAKQDRMEQLGDGLRRIQAEKSAPAKPTLASRDGNGTQGHSRIVSVKVSSDVAGSPAFKAAVADVPHTLMQESESAKGGDLVMTEQAMAQLQREVDQTRQQKSNTKLDELAESLRAVQAANIDLRFEGAAVDAAQTNEVVPAEPGSPVPTPGQVDAQALGGSAPAPSPAQNPDLGVRATADNNSTDTPSIVTGAAAPGNPSPPPPATAPEQTPPAGTPPTGTISADPSAPQPAPGNAPVVDGPKVTSPVSEGVPPSTVAGAAEPASPAPPIPREVEMSPIPSPEANAGLAAQLHKVSAKDDRDGVSGANGKMKPDGKTDAPKAYTGDPLEQRVNVDFREMELTNVVALLASKAGINVIAGMDLTGTVTANLHNVPLRQAMETALRMNGLGMVEEEGIYRIVTYEEAIANKRVSQMITLQNAKADEVEKVLEEIVKGSQDERHVTVSSNATANLLVVSGPAARVPQLIAMATQLDIAKPVLPTVTQAIKLNYAEPKDVLPTVTAMLSKDVGKVATDERSRHLIVTDVPVIVENVAEMIKELDLPVRTVAIETMVVDVSLTDDTETGVDWVVNLLRNQSRREAALGDNGRFISDVQNLAFETNMPGGAEAGALTFGLLTGNVNVTGIIKAEIQNFDGKIMSSPTIITVENKPATITIAEEIPYIELVQSAAGGQQNKTSFKEVGTIMEVTPRVAHDNYIISDMRVKESNTNGTFQNIPIESKRELSTSLRTADGQTVFMGGLRKNSDNLTIRKVPVLGDIPVVNFLFRNNKKIDRKNEMVVFITCRVVKDQEEMTPYQQDKLDSAADPRLEVQGGNELFETTVHPGDHRDPVWKYRRTSR